MNGKAMEQIEALADRVSKAFGDYVATGFAAMGKKVAELQAKIEAFPIPVNGKDGDPGKDAPGVDPDELAAMVAAAVAAEMAKLPVPKDGKDAEPVDFDAMVKTVVAAIPVPKDGLPGKDAEPVDYDRIGKAIEEVVATIPKPKDGSNGIDGKSIEPAQVKAMVDEVVSALPPALDGVDAVSIPGQDGQDGEAGQPGRDALELDVLDGIDEKRGYPRGTFAAYKGGLIRAVRSTEPITDGLVKAGWAVIVEGVAEVGVEQGDDLRTFAIGVQTTSGKASVYKFSTPVMIHRGVFKAGTDYVRGDVATWDGSSWHCEHETKAEPGNSQDWKLIAKRGANGKDAVPIKGDPGPAGRNGKDLTQLGPDGAKW